MSNDALRTYSLTKAYNKVQNSGKMHLFNSIPAITTALLGTSLALTQPGKLSARAAQGLGFLALCAGFDKVVDTTRELSNKLIAKKENKTGNKVSNEERQRANALTSIAQIGILCAGVIALPKLISKAKTAPALNKITSFIGSEASKLANEINKTKPGQFVENTLNPFMQKHAKATKALEVASCLGIIAGSAAGQIKLHNSMSKDMTKYATDYFEKGKKIQQVARNHFDSVDAVEV